MSEKIEPALTPDQWWDQFSARKNTPIDERLAEYMRETGATEDQARRVFIRSAAVDLWVAGYFKREDVAELRQEADRAADADHHHDNAGYSVMPCEHMRDLADRIEALLPPEDA